MSSYRPTRRFLGAGLAVIFAALFVGAAPGQAVRITHDVGGVVSRGSGALVAHDEEASYYITCGHLFDDGPGQTKIRIPNAAEIPAQIVATDRPHDLALLRSWRVRGATLLYDPEIEVRGDLSAYGFGGSGRFRGVRGSVVGYATPSGARFPSLRMRGSVRSGDSGGPVLDEDRRLVAVVWGERDGETYATFGEPLRAMMARLAQCRGGICRPVPPVCRPHAASGGVEVTPSPGRLAPVNREPKSGPALFGGKEASDRLDRIEEAIAGIQCECRCEGSRCEMSKIEQKFASLEVAITGLGARLGQPSASPQARRHYTLVADRGADYWQRLSDEYRRARESYQGVRLSPPPPGRTGPLPALVEWEEKTPVGNVGGYRAVSEALHTLAQGQGPRLN